MATPLSPTGVLSKLLDISPSSARILWVGLGVVSAAAIAVSFNVDVYTAGAMGLYIASLGIVLLLIAQALEDGPFKAFVGKILTLVLIAIVVCFAISSIFRSSGWIKPSYCLVEFWKNCDEIERNITSRNKNSIEASNTIPSVATNTNPAIDPSTYQVDIQFAGLITRESIVALNNSLRAAKWKVNGPSGERTQNSAGLNEVRYGQDADRPAARALADAVAATRVGASTIDIKRVPVIQQKRLEIWISN